MVNSIRSVQNPHPHVVRSFMELFNTYNVNINSQFNDIILFEIRLTCILKFSLYLCYVAVGKQNTSSNSFSIAIIGWLSNVYVALIFHLFAIRYPFIEINTNGCNLHFMKPTRKRYELTLPQSVYVMHSSRFTVFYLN